MHHIASIFDMSFNEQCYALDRRHFNDVGTALSQISASLLLLATLQKALSRMVKSLNFKRFTFFGQNQGARTFQDTMAQPPSL
jgi:hypothetical protein